MSGTAKAVLCCVVICATPPAPAAFVPAAVSGCVKCAALRRQPLPQGRAHGSHGRHPRQRPGLVRQRAATTHSDTNAVPLPTSEELRRLELKEVPVNAACKFLFDWGGKRVPDRDGITLPGVPRTNMPVTTELKDNMGLRLMFDASPQDTLEVDVYPLNGDAACCVVVSRGSGGVAIKGGLGPQVAALLRVAEDRINAKLQADLKTFAQDYHFSPAARRARGELPELPDELKFLEEEEEEEDDEYDPTYSLGHGIIDVTPRPPKEEFNPWAPAPEPAPKRQPQPETRGAFWGGELQDVKQLTQTKEMRDAAFAMYEDAVEAGADEGEFQRKGIKGVEGVLEGLRMENATNAQLSSMFEAGKRASIQMGKQQGQLMVPLEEELVQLNVILEGTGLKGGWDIFAGPARPIGGQYQPSERQQAKDARQRAEERGEEPRLYTMYDEDGEPVLQLTEGEIERLDQDALAAQLASLDVLVNELVKADDALFNQIVTEYKDVLLNDYYILSMRARIPKMRSERERSVMARMNAYAVNLIEQLAVVAQRAEAQQLDKIKMICEQAMKDMNGLPDFVRSIKPLLDQDFVGYLKYAIQKEKDSISSNGLNPDREPSQWLQVLGIIRRGVYAELEKDIYRDVEEIHCVFRMKRKKDRKALLAKTIDKLPTLDVRGFKSVAANMIMGVRQRTDVDQDLRDNIEELALWLDELLPGSRVEEMSRGADQAARDKLKRAEAELAEYDRRRVPYDPDAVTEVPLPTPEFWGDETEEERQRKLDLYYNPPPNEADKSWWPKAKGGWMNPDNDRYIPASELGEDDEDDWRDESDLQWDTDPENRWEPRPALGPDQDSQEPKRPWGLLDHVSGEAATVIDVEVRRDPSPQPVQPVREAQTKAEAEPSGAARSGRKPRTPRRTAAQTASAK